MKTYLTKTKILALALVALFTTSIAGPAFALNDDDKNVAITYIGNRNDKAIYRLKLKNETKEVYFISVTDKDGNFLHSERVNGANIIRNYQVNDEFQGDENGLTFTITNINHKTVSVYKIKKVQKIISEVIIDKVK